MMLLIPGQKKLKKFMIIKAISFDLDDTLWPLLPVIIKAEQKTNAWLKKNYPAASRLIQSDSMLKIRNRLIRENPKLVYQLSNLRSHVLSELGLEAGFSKEDSEKMAKDSFEIFFEERNKVSLYDGAEETLKALKDKFILGAITNGNADLKKIGLDHIFKITLSASDVNAGKPDPKIFEAFIEKTGFRPQEICHVGDHPKNDIEGALNAGMKAIWFNEKKIDNPFERSSVIEINSWKELEPEIIRLT